MTFAKVCVVGLGYIGLPTAAVLASRGVAVHGVDLNPRVVETVGKGNIHIVEPGLEDVVREAVRSGLLTAHTGPAESDAYMIAVPTPFGNGTPDLSHVRAAVESVAPYLRKGNLVVIESTCPVGSTHEAARWISDLRPDLRIPSLIDGDTDIFMAYCPERVLPGKVLVEIVANDRVIGGLDRASTARASALYAMFVKGERVETDARTAEMCKLTENSFRDLNIAFANELSLICAEQGIDVWELISIANRHPRVNILQPGPGVGGHCIAVDPWFIVSSAPRTARLIRTAREVNDSKPLWVIGQVRDAISRFHAEKGSRKPTIACYGLSFKPDVDDFRESPALHIVETLAQDDTADLMIVEPYLSVLPPSLRGRAVLSAIDGPASQADISVILVDHREFKAGLRPSGTVIDCKGIVKGERNA